MARPFASPWTSWCNGTGFGGGGMPVGLVCPSKGVRPTQRGDGKRQEGDRCNEDAGGGAGLGEALRRGGVLRRVVRRWVRLLDLDHGGAGVVRGWRGRRV